mmetsp:Transcript_22551/g.58375  ORF Transcript_22551/g.58375 Transcript_22551/m.58375 type:complete len:491 (-) Transcript_22551:3609-5081(-)
MRGEVRLRGRVVRSVRGAHKFGMWGRGASTSPLYPLRASVSFLFIKCRETVESTGTNVRPLNVADSSNVPGAMLRLVTRAAAVLRRQQTFTFTMAAAVSTADAAGGGGCSSELSRVARFIASDDCQNICILSGAGVSVAAGIPDFRSPGGMYDTLKPELITATPRQRSLMATDPTYVVEVGTRLYPPPRPLPTPPPPTASIFPLLPTITDRVHLSHPRPHDIWFRTLQYDMFMENAFPYLEVRRPFILGTAKQQWKSTISHHFFDLLHEQGKLARLYTQNIDGLDFQTHIPRDKIVPVHGSIGAVACEACNHPMDTGAFCELVQSNIKDIYRKDAEAPSESSPILCEKCGKPTVKPTTVLFGAGLPEVFFDSMVEDLPTCDLLIVAGTSLVVSPANMVAYKVPSTTMRLVANREPVGQELGITYGTEGGRDVFAEGDCDECFAQLAQELGLMGKLMERYDLLPEASQLLLDRLDGNGGGGNEGGVAADVD